MSTSPAYRNATPNAYFDGIQDNPAPGLTSADIITAQHTPLGYIYSAWGDPKKAYYVIGNDLNTIFGSKTWDVNSDYFNHYSDFAKNIFAANANGQFLIRIKPTDAKTAYGRLYCEYVATDVAQYERNTDGSYKLDANGHLHDLGSVLAGFKIRFVWEPIADPADAALGFKNASVKEGTLTGTDPAVKSKMVPLMDVPATYFGKRGNNLALVLDAPTAKSVTPADIKYIADTGNQLFRMGFHEKEESNTTTIPWYTIDGEASFDFTMIDGLTKPGTNAPVGFNTQYKSKYTNVNVPVNGKEITGPFDKIHIYQDLLKAMLTELHNAEKGQPSATHASNVNSINFLSALDVNGHPYYKIEMGHTADYTDASHVVLGPNTKLYLSGGNDGTMSDAEFDKAVKSKLKTFGKDGIELYDYARYPFTALWDSGFSMDTKYEFYPITSIRPDVMVFTATQDVTEDANTADEDLAAAIALSARAAIQVESSVYGTPFTRGVLCPWAGTPVNGEYKKLSTLNRDLADKISKWMGANTGKWTPGQDMDLAPRKNITTMTVDNYSYKPLSSREKMWASQLIAVEYSTMNQLIFSGYQTMNKNDSSVLNTIPTVMGCIAATRACMYSFKNLVGNSKYTANQMIKRSNKNITQKLVGVGDDRLVFEPWTKVEGVDADVGYAWASGCKVYANLGWTVNTITINSYTMAALTAASQ